MLLDEPLGYLVGQMRPRTDGGRASLLKEDAITRLIGTLLFEHDDEWQSQNRYIRIAGFALIDAVHADPLVNFSSQAASPRPDDGQPGFSTTLTD